MATIDYTITQFDGHPNVKTVTWSGLGNGDVGRPFKMLEFESATAQITGTYSTSTISVEGSNEGSNFGILFSAIHGSTGNEVLTWTAADLIPRDVEGKCLEIRPNCTAGGGPTDLNLHLVVRRDYRP